MDSYPEDFRGPDSSTQMKLFHGRTVVCGLGSIICIDVDLDLGVMERGHVRGQRLTRLGLRGGLNQSILGWERQPDQSSFEAGPILGNILFKQRTP